MWLDFNSNFQYSLTVLAQYNNNNSNNNNNFFNKNFFYSRIKETNIWKHFEIYKKADICDSISKTFDRNRGDLLTQNNEPKYRIPLTLTYNRTLSNVKEALKKHWNILQINNEFKGVFSEPPFMCFRRNKKFKDFHWMKTTVNNKA